MGGGFSPASLFAAGEAGVWYDPTDFSTMFQDAAGTTPVTAVEQPVGLLLDKSKGLALGAELVTNGDFASGTSGWSAGFGTTTSTLTVPSGAGLLTVVSPDTTPRYGRAITGLTVGTFYRISCDTFSSSGTGDKYIGWTSLANLTGGEAWFQNQTTPRYYPATATTMYVWFGFNGGAAGATITIDNITVKALPGNHASQSTAASRPVLSARVNLLERSNEFSTSPWAIVPGGLTLAQGVSPPFGSANAWTITEAVNTSFHGVFQPRTLSVTGHTFSCYLKAGERTWCRLSYDGGGNKNAWFNLSTGTVGTVNAGLTAAISSAGSGWYLCSISFTGAASGSTAVGPATGDNGSDAYLGNGTSRVYIFGADLRVTNDGVGLPPYQRIAAATDYDTNGFPLYLAFDGVDDSLATGSIDFSATDKATYWVGARKLSGSGPQYLMELGTGIAENAFNIVAPPSLDAAAYDFRVATHQRQTLGSYASPVSNVLSVQQNLAGASAAAQTVARINSIQLSLTGTNVGTGNFINAPIHIGRRAGASGPFNGRLHQLIVRGAQSSTAQIASTELFINAKTEAY